MNDQHAPLRLKKMHVVHHLGPPPIKIENRLPHQMLIEQDPPRLIDKGRIRFPLGRRFHHNR